jgi:micrococcal nuclease
VGRLPGGVPGERERALTGLRGRVVWVVDGDTIHVRLGRRLERVRYIGVNAPEIPHPTKGFAHGGRKARGVNRRLVGGRTVRLELDVQRRDDYGRLLAYVWTAVNGEKLMANAEMVRRGYAQVMTIPPNVKYWRRFVRLEREARMARRGLWRRWR